MATQTPRIKLSKMQPEWKKNAEEDCTGSTFIAMHAAATSFCMTKDGEN